MRRTVSTILLIALGGCAPPPPLNPSATVDASALTDSGKEPTATVHVVSLCSPRELRKGGPNGHGGTDLFINYKSVAKIGSCDYRVIPVPAGNHTIWLKTTSLHLIKLLNGGLPFTVREHGHAYFVIDRKFQGAAREAFEVPEARGRQLILAIQVVRAKR